MAADAAQPPPLAERLRRLGAWADRFADPAFTTGSWVPSRTDAHGVIHMGWFEVSNGVQEFVSEMYALGWVHSFDWMAWLATEDGQRLSKSAGAITETTADQLANLLTAIIRGERFGDGQIEGAFESGILPAIAQRARALADREP
jgi:hypothetical protein